LADREAHKREKKSHITEAAARVFARRGFFGTVMAEIAAEAGIGKGTLYECNQAHKRKWVSVLSVDRHHNA